MADPKKTAPRKPSQKLEALEALQNDAVSGSDPFPITLRGETLLVKPILDWPAKVLGLISNGDLDAWAMRCLTPESAEKWEEMEPTLRELNDVFGQVGEATGQDLGELLASLRS